MRARTDDQLAYTAKIGDRVSEQRCGHGGDERRATGLRQTSIDGQCRRALKYALIDAEKPEGRAIEDQPAPGLEEDGNGRGENGKQKQKHEQEGDGETLDGKRNATKEVFTENGKQEPLQGEDEDSGERSAGEDSDDMA